MHGTLQQQLLALGLVGQQHDVFVPSESSAMVDKDIQWCMRNVISTHGKGKLTFCVRR